MVKGRFITKYLIDGALKSPLRVGNTSDAASPILISETDNLPFIQSSSLTGAIRSAYLSAYGEDAVQSLFGGRGDDALSRICISDAVFARDTIKYEIRPRVSIDPVSGTTSSSLIKGTDLSSGHKFDIECVGKGASFTFSMFMYHDEKEQFVTEIKNVLAMLNGGGILLGGQKSNGFGEVCLNSVWMKTFDLTSKEDRDKWIKEDELQKGEYTDIVSELKPVNNYAYNISFSGKTRNGLLVKGYGKKGFGKGFADVFNIVDVAGDYIIPGSSTKGVIRSRIEMIVKYLGKENAKEVITDIFGGTDNDSRIGNLRVRDCVIGDREKNDQTALSHRIHVDKLTGGVFSGGLFSEKRAYGNIKLEFDISDRNNPEVTCGYLVMVLRDLAAGMINLGSGGSVGNGDIIAEKLMINAGDKSASIDFKTGSINDADGIIEKCLYALKGD